MTINRDKIERVAVKLPQAALDAWVEYDPPEFKHNSTLVRDAFMSGWLAASIEPPADLAVVSFLREKADQRPSEGLMERQKVDEAAIRYGQALLKACADEIENWQDRCAMCGTLLPRKWVGDDEPHCHDCLTAFPDGSAYLAGLCERLRLGGIRFASESKAEAATRRNLTMTEAADAIEALSALQQGER